MKVLRLRFKNIHSLKGEHFLDFTVPPLSDAGLFAIIGPTGAGKSTLLDVITLALFNRIPRFASKGTESISKNDMEKMGSVMTHFTDDAYAEIEYKTHQGIFRSTWRISKARTGNLKDYEMNLSELIGDASEGIDLGLKKSLVPAKNEQLLGLKYEQFIRSILLSQGDFARLLRSDDKERAALMEDITDTGIYREIGKKTFETAKLKRQEIETLRTQMGFFKYLSDEDIEIKKATISESQQSNKNLDVQMADYSERVKNLSQQLLLTARSSDIKNNLHLLQNKKTAYISKAEKLKKHQALDVFREQFSVWQMDKRTWQQTSEEVSDLQKELRRDSEAFTDVLAKMSQFTGQEVNDDNFMMVMKQFEQEVNHLDAQLGFIKENGQKIRQRLQQILEKEFNGGFIKWATIKPQESLSEVELHIRENQTVAGQDALDVLNKSKDDISKTRDHYIKIQHVTSHLERKIAESAALESQKVTVLNKITENNQLLTFQEKELGSIEEKIAILGAEKEKWLEIASLDDHRAKLQDGKPCPLCGAAHHPYAHDLPVKVLDFELQIRSLSQQATQVKDSIKILTIAISKDQSTIENIKNAVSKNQEEIKLLIESNGNNTLTSTELTAEIGKIEEQLQVLSQKVNARSNLQILETIKAILLEINQLLEEHAGINSKRQALYKGQNVSNEANTIQNQYVTLKESSQRLSTTIKTKEADASRVFLKWTEMTKELEKEIFKLSYQNIDDAIKDLLPDDILRQYLAERDALTHEETSLMAQAKQTEADLTLLKNVEGDQSTLERLKIQVAEMQNEKDKLNTLIGAIQNELEQDAQQRTDALKLKDTIDKKEKQANPYLHLNELIGDKDGNKYAKFAQNISLKHLIFLANQRLNKLTDRYLLKMTEIEEDFRVMDLYQAGIDRSVKTLSGGETFIVSLALALSLSDMASQNVKLESLFIDEGFGTLDQETLETAMITLEKLQSESNRNIGIISHVDSLKERITTQIRVHKNSQGYSELEVV